MTNPHPSSMVLDKIDWLLNEKHLARQQIELCGPDALLSASARMADAHRIAFELLPELRAALTAANVDALRDALDELVTRIEDAWPELRNLPPMIKARAALNSIGEESFGYER